MKCPVCNAELPATAKFCGGCGTTLSAPAPPPTGPTYEPSRPVMNAAPSYGSGGFSGGSMPVVQKKYKLLRLIAVLMKILAVLLGVVLIIVGLVMMVAGATAGTQTTPSFPDTGPTALFGGLVGGLIAIVYGVFVFVFLYAYAEWMYVFMDIEENTRVTNEMLTGRK
jgi:zinc ribbon protein